jgi:acyl-CoA dehydrogenase
MYYRQLVWAAATFANLSDLAMLTLGGALKRRETLTGRFADMLSWMYLGSATLRRFEAEGRQPKDLPLVHWALQYALAQIQQAIEGIISHLSLPLSGLVLGWWRLNSIGALPSDQLGHQVAQILQRPGGGRDRLTANIHIPDHPEEPLGRLEQALRLSVQTESVTKTIKDAIKAEQLPKAQSAQLIDAALETSVISETEAALIREAEALRTQTIQVDAFTLEEYRQHHKTRKTPVLSGSIKQP